MKKFLTNLGRRLRPLIKPVRFLVSRTAVGIYIAAAIVDVAFLSFVALAERPLLFGHHAPRPTTHYWDALLPYTNYALIILVCLLLIIPILWLYNFHKRWQIFNTPTDDKEGQDEARRDFLEWLTVTSIPFLVLGFAMVIEFHAIAEKPEDGAGAIAAIMVLYALSVLASFLFIEIRVLKKSISHELAEASSWLRISLDLAETTAGEKPPATSAKGLLQAWGDIYNAAHKKAQSCPQLNGDLLVHLY
jgi:hypothetical protein